MALFEVLSGGGANETLIWRNSAPTSDFNGGTNIISWDVLSEYDAIKIVWKGTKTDSDSNTLYMIVPIVNKVYYVSGYTASWGINANISSTKGYTRQFYITESNGLTIGSKAQRIQDTSSIASSCIPLEIYGIK